MERLIKREELLLLIFEDAAQPMQAQQIGAQLKVSMAEFETVFGLAVATTSDPAVAATLGVQWGQQQQQLLQQHEQQQSAVAAVLFDSGVAKHFPGPIHGEDAAIEVRVLSNC